VVKSEEIEMCDFGRPLKVKRISLKAKQSENHLGKQAVVYLSNETGRCFETKPLPSVAIIRYPAAEISRKMDEEDIRKIIVLIAQCGERPSIYKQENECSDARWCYKVEDDSSPVMSGSRVIVDFENHAIEVQSIAYE
jgi:hypothetical protein